MWPELLKIRYLKKKVRSVTRASQIEVAEGHKRGATLVRSHLSAQSVERVSYNQTAKVYFHSSAQIVALNVARAFPTSKGQKNKVHSVLKSLDRKLSISSAIFKIHMKTTEEYRLEQAIHQYMLYKAMKLIAIIITNHYHVRRTGIQLVQDISVKECGIGIGCGGKLRKWMPCLIFSMNDETDLKVLKYIILYRV